MKKLCCGLLSILLLFTLFACGKEAQAPEGIPFYYRSQALDEAVIQPEYRQDVSENVQLQEIIDLYLQGPFDAALQSPFAGTVKALSVYQDGNTVYIQLNENMGRLSGLELSIACGCIAKTCLGLTDAQYVEISAENSLLDGAKSIRIGIHSLLLQDETTERSE